MCNCRSEIETRLIGHVGGQLPDGHQKLTVSLEGYAFMLGAELAMKNIMPIRIEYEAPTRAGVMKTKKKTMNMHGNYCMFCGEKYKKDVEPEDDQEKSA